MKVEDDNKDYDAKLAEGHSNVMDKITLLLSDFIKLKACVEEKVLKLNNSIEKS
jgi:hypothetical protein